MLSSSFFLPCTFTAPDPRETLYSVAAPAAVFMETTMVSSRSGCQITEKNPSNPIAQESNEEDGQRKKISDYEQSREDRIRENLERMEKLGIFDLSLRVKAFNKPIPKARKTPSTRSTPLISSPLPPSGPVRRSSRLQNATPVSYSESCLTKKDKTLEIEDQLLREEGSKPEIYSEEHEKLLGSTEMSWTLFVDGVGKDGKRIYDPVNGKTCHQCRQKTLGRRTHCSQCNMVQGQFCGDCLYMRYGENVIEANQNPNWICPVCRGICNCSLCRQAKGWPPTGTLYRKISSLGYKSVAHYLIQTRRLKPESEPDSNSKVPVSAKRSLPFKDIEETSKDMVLMDSKDPQSEGENSVYLPCDKQEGKTQCSDDGEADFKQDEGTHFLDKKEVDCKQEEKTHFLDVEQGDHKLDMQTKMVCPTELNDENSLSLGPRSNVPGEDNAFLGHDLKGTIQVVLDFNVSNHEHNCEKGDKIYPDSSEMDCILAPESSPESSKKRVRTTDPAGDNIAERLRSRSKKGHAQEEHRPSVKQDSNGLLHEHNAVADVNNSSSSSKATVMDNNGRRLRQSGAEVGKEQEETALDISSPVSKTKSSKSKKKRTPASEPSPDSIAGRLRQRRIGAGSQDH